MDNGAVVGQTAGTALDMWQKLAFTLILVASFILLYQRRKFSAAVAGLRFYGRMSLTNYISQSVIGAFVYFPFGLYLAPRCGYTASLLARDSGVPAAGAVLQMVAGEAQTGAVGIYLA